MSLLPAAGGDPQLWHDALEYFARQPGDCSQQVGIQVGAAAVAQTLMRLLCTSHRLGCAPNGL